MNRRLVALGGPLEGQVFEIDRLPFSIGRHSSNDLQLRHIAVSRQQCTIERAPDGSFLVTWNSNLQDGDSRGVYAQRYDASGNAVGDEFRVSTSTSGNQWRASATATDSGFLVAWEGAGTGEARGIYTQAYQTGSDVTATVGDGRDDPTITFRGTVAEVNEALDGLEADTAMRGILGEDFVKLFTTVKRFELARFRDHVTDWERDEYLEIH